MDQAVLDEAFRQARLKVQWAHHRFTEAEFFWRKYLESDFCVLREETDPESGGQLFFADAKPVPVNVILSLADGFHALNSSLDYVATGMMRAATGTTSRIGFPTEETRHRLRKTFMAPKPGKGEASHRRITKTFPGFAWLLLMKIKPYLGGNFLCAEVRKLDNIDKHNLIVPIVTVAEINGIEMLDRRSHNVFHTGAAVGAGGQLKLIHYVNEGKLEIANKGNATATITFPQGLEVFGGQPIFPTSLQCLQGISEALSIIQKDGVKLPARVRARV